METGRLARLDGRDARFPSFAESLKSQVVANCYNHKFSCETSQLAVTSCSKDGIRTGMDFDVLLH
jgi:hypothetical protein